MVMALIASASAFGWFMAYLRIPAKATELLLSITTNKVLLLLLINVLLLLLGMIMDMAPLILITRPILYPVVVDTLGDVVHSVRRDGGTRLGKGLPFSSEIRPNSSVVG